MHWPKITETLGSRVSGVTLVLLLLGFCLPVGSVWALGLGDITVRSYLGQPLRARIELISRSPGELEGVTARLATAEDFRLVGMNRMSLSVPLAFSVQTESSGGFVDVQSMDPVSDPVVQFVVEVNFANGRLLRQYTVFLDPPTVSAPVPLPAITPSPQRSERAEPEVAPATPVEAPEPEPERQVDNQPVIREAPAAEPREGPSETNGGPEVENVVEMPAVADSTDDTGEPEDGGAVKETLRNELDEDLSEPVSGDEPPVESPPTEADELESKEVDSLPDADRVGEEEVSGQPAEPESEPVEIETESQGQAVTSEPDAGSEPEPEAEPEPEPQLEPETPPEKPAALEEEPATEAPAPEPTVDVGETDDVASQAAYQVTQQELESYGPVQGGQTMWSIASEVSAGSDFSVNQVMLAIQRYNPEAFAQNNINLLKSGTILRLPPPSEVARMTARQAMLESMRQAEDYAEILAGRAPELRPAPVLATPGPDQPEVRPPEAVASAADEGRLELIPPADDPGLGGDSGVGAGEEPTGAAEAGSASDKTLLTEEEQEAVAQESEYLSQKLEELQQELDGTDPAIEVQDKGLAEMEQRLREQRSADDSDGGSAQPDQGSPATASAARETESILTRALPWALFLLLVVVTGGVVWWMRRRSGVGPEGPDHGPGPTDSTEETTRVIVDEAEDILRTLDTSADSDTPASESDEGTEEEAEELTRPVIDLEDYIGHIEKPTSDAEEEEDPGDEAMDDSGDRGADSDFVTDSESSGGEAETKEGSMDSPERVPLDQGSEDESMEDDLQEEDEDAEANDPETKLDLARAYISMGDAEAARELLNEVLQDGNEAQIAEASAMMSEI